MSASRLVSGRRNAARRWRFVASAGVLGCNSLVELTVDAYEDVRASATHFVLAPGHEIPAIERVIEREATYVVVEKEGEAAEFAEETDPREE